VNAVIVTPVTPVILTITKKSKSSLDSPPTTSVKLNAHLISYATKQTPPTVARWIVSITAKNALTPPPVTPVQMVITKIPPTHARFAPQTVILALPTPTVTPVQLVTKVMYAKIV